MAKITFDTSGLESSLDALQRQIDGARDANASEAHDRIIDALDEVHSVFTEFQNILDGFEAGE